MSPLIGLTELYLRGYEKVQIRVSGGGHTCLFSQGAGREMEKLQLDELNADLP
jgi:hypothetical protein